MSKVSKKPVKGNKKVTDYFSWSSVTSSPSSSSEPTRSSQLVASQPAQSQKANALTASQGQKKTAIMSKEKNVPRLDQDVISVSSGITSHISVSSGSRSHISISSESSSPIIVADSNRPSKESSSSDIEVIAVKKGFKPRMGAPKSSAVATVRRAPQRPLLKRKLELDSDSDIPAIEKVDYPRTSQVIVSAPPVSSRSSSLGLQSVPPLTPKDTLLSLPSDGPASIPSTPSKRARLNPPTPSKPTTAVSSGTSGNEADVEDVIPSSQSDEHELTGPKQIQKDAVQTRLDVDEWRKGTVLSSSTNDLPSDAFDPPDVPMDVDIPVSVPESVTMDGSASDPAPGPLTDNSKPSSDKEAQTSEAEVSAQLRRSHSNSSIAGQPHIVLSSTPNRQTDSDDDPFRQSFDNPAPPASQGVSALPATPVALDPATKTKQLIADILADVKANVSSSPAEEMPTFRDELESSDDDDHSDEDIFFTSKGKGKSRDFEPPSSPLSSLSRSSPELPDSRYHFRNRSPALGSSGPSNKLPRLVATQDARQASTSRRKVNPLDALLREKTLNDKRGHGSEALAAAEAALVSASKAKRRSKKGELLEDDVDYADEAAAMRIVHERAYGSSFKSSSRHLDSDSDSDSDGVKLGAADYEKFLGEKGKAVGKIIEKDREVRSETGKDKNVKAVQGVSLWVPVPLLASTKKKNPSRRKSLPPSPLTDVNLGANSLASSLNAAASFSDITRIAMIVRPHCLLRLEPAHRASLFDWIFNLVFRTSDSAVTHFLFETLEYLPDCCEDGSIVLTHNYIISALSLLGASPDALETVGWSTSNEANKEHIDPDRRSLLLSCLISLLVTLFRKHCLRITDVPAIILSLLLVALDMSTSTDTQNEIRVGLDSMLSCIEDTDPGHLLENEIALRVLQHMEGLELINKAYLLSFFNRGCSQNGRIARWIAHASLLQANDVSVGTYCALPPLRPLLPLLSPPVGSHTPFDIPGNPGVSNYFEDLGHHVEILNVALTDIDGYVREEANTPRAETADNSAYSILDSPKKGAVEKPLTELETVKTHLDMLHGKIADTRAAHLDRSRVKAALQHLSFRVHYQRLAYLRSGSSSSRGLGKPRNLRGYFGAPIST